MNEFHSNKVHTIHTLCPTWIQHPIDHYSDPLYLMILKQGWQLRKVVTEGFV